MNTLLRSFQTVFLLQNGYILFLFETDIWLETYQKQYSFGKKSEETTFSDCIEEWSENFWFNFKETAPD